MDDMTNEALAACIAEGKHSTDGEDPCSNCGNAKDATPNGAGAMASAAGDDNPHPRTQAAALAYFMGEEPPPGLNDRIPLDVDFGSPETGANWQPCVFKPLANEALVKCEELAQVRNDQGAVERIDPFTRWSYVFAYSCVTPDLAAALEARRAKGEQLADTAAVVREVFRYQPGVLKAVSYTVEERSRLAEDKERAVREIEAGKD